MRLLTAAEQRELDRLAAEADLPTRVLMESAGAAVARAVAAMRPRNVVVFCGPGNNGGAGPNGVEDHRYSNTAMKDLALMLMIYANRQIVDQTGLQGRYDFELRWTKDEANAPADGSAPPGLFTALQEQVGLKLEAVKAPADVLVIDKVERPNAN